MNPRIEVKKKNCAYELLFDGEFQLEMWNKHIAKAVERGARNYLRIAGGSDSIPEISVVNGINYDTIYFEEHTAASSGDPQYIDYFVIGARTMRKYLSRIEETESEEQGDTHAHQVAVLSGRMDKHARQIQDILRNQGRIIGLIEYLQERIRKSEKALGLQHKEMGLLVEADSLLGDWIQRIHKQIENATEVP